MTVVGDPGMWSDTFPDHLVPRILDLVMETWEAFEKPGPTDYEVPITRRLRRALKQAKDYKRLPVRIERESTEDDLLTGEELGRIDLKFLPAISALEEVYFAFECKRLNMLENGKRRTLAPEYVTEGMMRFVTGKYASVMRHGGMLGYVLDGRCNDAIRLVKNNIRKRCDELQLDIDSLLVQSRLRPNNLMIRETGHRLSRSFLLHHVFLSCR
jgi:hypothetical protein